MSVVRIFNLLIATFMGSMVIAQDSGLLIGLNIGPNTSNMSQFSRNQDMFSEFQKSTYNDYFYFHRFFEGEYKPQVGIVIDIQIEYKFRNNWSVRSGYGLTFKNYVSQHVYQDWLETTTYHSNIKLSYGILPVNLKYELGNKFKAYGIAGVYYGFLIFYEFTSQTSDYWANNLRYYGEFKTNNPAFYANRYDFGGQIGIGLSTFLSEKLRVHFEVLKSSSLIPISELPVENRLNSTSFTVGISALIWTQDSPD